MPSQSPTRSMPAGVAAMVVLLCLALIALIGCDGDSGATPPPETSTPSPSTSPTPSPTPSRPAPPTLPPSAKGLTVESADAFTRFYLTLLDHAALTGDVGPLRAWSDHGCGGCGDLVRDFANIHSAGGAYSGDFAYRNFSATSIRLNLPKAEVRFKAAAGRHTVLEKRGATPIVYPGETINWRAALLARSGQWVLYEIEDEAG